MDCSLAVCRRPRSHGPAQFWSHPQACGQGMVQQPAGTGLVAAAMSDGYKAVAVPGTGGAGGRGVDVITDHEGEVVGIAVSQVAQVYTMVDRIISSQRILALPLSDRYSLAGKVAAVPDEHGRLIERLASAVATSFSEAGALNALYLMDICKDLVPGFKAKIPDGRLEKAAELSPHSRAKDFVLQGQKPPEWARAEQDKGTVILLPEEETDLLTETGRAVGDATKFVGGAAFGGVGLVTDTLGITKNAEDKLASTAEDAVDLVGSGVSSVVGAVDQGLDGTAKDLQRKGVVGAVGDGVADAVDIVSDFVSDTVTGIADGVHGILNFATGTEEGAAVPVQETHLVKIVIAELFGAEKTLGLRIESRVVTAFTKEEAVRLGWRLGDCILAVGRQRVPTQEALLAGISGCKEALRMNGTPIEFLVERMGARP
ncbi:unnamed protein product [Symbiodinium sp. CCMP2592]|nr:unnamed protein product [Symbiodinium sp. CCMP2592]